MKTDIKLYKHNDHKFNYPHPLQTLHGKIHVGIEKLQDV